MYQTADCFHPKVQTAIFSFTPLGRGLRVYEERNFKIKTMFSSYTDIFILISYVQSIDE